jgi:hypothetical protein
MRRSLPSMLSRQPRSPPTTASARRWQDEIAFALGDRRRHLAELDREGAAEAAAFLGQPFISLSWTPFTFASSARGCALMPMLRRPLQESW